MFDNPSNAHLGLEPASRNNLGAGKPMEWLVQPIKITKRFAPPLLLGSLLLLAASCAQLVEEPDIQPGERPSLESDEAGLWMVMEKAEARLKTSGRVVQDPEFNEYVRDLVCQMARGYCHDIRVYVIRRAGFNASITPTGTLQIWTGLFLRLENEAQLAFVIGHEISHYVSRHSLERWRYIRAATDSATFFGAVLSGGGVWMGTAAQLVTFGSIFAYSRDQESEADELGFQMLTEAGYPPAEASKLWRIVQDEEYAAGQSDGVSFLATHPSTETRTALLRQLADAKSEGQPGTTGGERYLTSIQALRSEWLREELHHRNYGGFEYLLSRLIDRGRDVGELYYFQGELYRLRDEIGDNKRAVQAYHKAIQHEPAPVETYRSLGLVQWSLNRRKEAKRAFQRYLDLAPAAEDRKMIQAHMEELQEG